MVAGQSISYLVQCLAGLSGTGYYHLDLQYRLEFYYNAQNT
jgi:hypothetical protein